ncbi:IS21-like element helper ATPase IstB [Enterococcus sp. AZ196]|uniref:IS21-like element helper ATPase IstB n=1 Tax=Enterococcus sp. AZ196 TaxID=2774659 RepID=UPI003D2E460E
MELTQKEVDIKEISAANSMILTANFPHNKRIDDFDFNFQTSVNQSQIEELIGHQFIDRLENVVFLGPSGVGKTHLATSIGIESARKRISTYFVKCHDLIQNLKKARNESRLESRLKFYSSKKLLIIDEIGYLPISVDDAKLFFQLIDRRYEKKSTLLTTNMPFKDWGEVFLDPKIANAILDRVLHHAHVVQITGNSYRIKDYLEEI